MEHCAKLEELGGMGRLSMQTGLREGTIKTASRDSCKIESLKVSRS
jgi:hypothetical protein